MSLARRRLPRAVVVHNGRLDILCCLDPCEPSSIAQVCSKTNLRMRQAKHHLRILAAFGLVRDKGDVEGGKTLYVTRLGQSPDWVAKAVSRHRLGAEG